MFDGQSERTKSRVGRWDSLFRIWLFHPHGVHPHKQPARWIAKREKEKGQKGGESIVSFNDNHRTFDRINRLDSMVFINIAGARERLREREGLE